MRTKSAMIWGVLVALIVSLAGLLATPRSARAGHGNDAVPITEIRRAPWRQAGIMIDGSSLPNMADEPDFILALHWFGLSHEEMDEVRALARAKKFELRALVEGMLVEDILGSNHKAAVKEDGWAVKGVCKNGPRPIGFHNVYITIRLKSGKAVRFQAECGNPLKVVVEGTEITRINYRQICKYLEKVCPVYLPGATISRTPVGEIWEVTHHDKEIVNNPNPPMYYPPGASIPLGSVQIHTWQIGSASLVWWEHQHGKCPCCPTQPGHGPGVSPPPPVVTHPPGAQGPPNPQPPWVDPAWPGGQLGPPPHQIPHR